MASTGGHGEMIRMGDLTADQRREMARRFADSGRLELADFLPATATSALRAELAGRGDWQMVMNAGDRVFELSRAAAAALTRSQRDELDRRVAAAGRLGFQYRFETIRVPDDIAARRRTPSLLTRFVEEIGSPRVLGAIGAITGIGDLRFADGQATAYSAGHFLTRHDDDVAGKDRRLAYVLSLSPDWRAEWGGLLMFHDAQGRISACYAPEMGTLRLFAVPADHSVSYVTPLAPEPRYAVTGWLRASVP